jgi:hypothetical protein
VDRGMAPAVESPFDMRSYGPLTTSAVNMTVATVIGCSISESERIWVSHSAADAIESARQEFKSHERFGRKRTCQRARAITREPEARIVLWVTQDDDDLLATFA